MEYTYTPTPAIPRPWGGGSQTHMGINEWSLDFNTKLITDSLTSKLLNQSWIICNAAGQVNRRRETRREWCKIHTSDAWLRRPVWPRPRPGYCMAFIWIKSASARKSAASLTDFCSSSSMGHLAHILVVSTYTQTYVYICNPTSHTHCVAIFLPIPSSGWAELN